MTPERLREIRAAWPRGIVAELRDYVDQIRAELLDYVDQIRAAYELKDALLTQAAAVTDAELALAEQCATEQALRLCREIETLRAEVERLSAAKPAKP